MGSSVYMYIYIYAGPSGFDFLTVLHRTVLRRTAKKIKPGVASSRIDLLGGSAQNGSAQNGSAWQPLVHRVLREVLPLLAVDSDCKIPSVEPLFILNLALIC